MSKYIGDVSAYAYAVSKGYTGTEEEFAELMASYADVGQTAVDAKDAAVAAKTDAQTAATTATNKASEATTAAQTATTKAGEAQTSAQTASSKASEASQSASQASGYAQTAETAKTDAQTAKTQAETARDNAVTAKIAAETAQGKAEDAQAAAERVAESIPSDYSQLSEDVSDLKSGFTNSITESLYDPTSNRNAVYYRTGGIITASSAWNATILYELEDGHEYYYSGLNNLGTAPVNCYFDSSRKYLSEFKSATGMQFLDIPSGAKYVAFSIKNEDVSTFEFNSVVNGNALNEKIDLLAHSSDMSSGVYADGTIGLESGTLSDTHSGVVELDSTIRLRTGYLPVPLGGINIEVASGYMARTFVFDKYFSFLSVSVWDDHINVSNTSRLIRIVIKKDDDTSITTDDFTKAFGNAFDGYEKIIDIRTMIQKNQADIDNLEKLSLVASIKDSAWSWWMYPQVLYKNTYKNSAIFGEITSAGKSGIAEVDLTTKQALKANLFQNNIDDHNGCALLSISGGFILAALTKHADEYTVHIYRTRNPEDITSYRAAGEIKVVFPNYVTYAQLFRLPNDKILLITRVGANSWYACYSEDVYGESWDEPFKLIDSDLQYYALFRPSTTNGILNVAMYSNPNLSSHDTRIRCAKYDAVNKIMYDASNNILGNSLSPVNYTDVPVVIDIPNYTPKNTVRNRLLDLAITDAGKYSVLYCRFSDAEDGVYHANISGNDYSIVEAGGCFYTPSFYYGGAVFNPININDVYLCRYINNRYKLEKYTLVNGVYTFIETLDQSNIDGLMYPVCRPIIDATGSVLFYQKGRTNLTSFNHYSYDAKYIELN